MQSARPPPVPWSWRRDGLLAAGLALATLAMRWPERSRTPYTVDSVLFALATESYDVTALRPHPPGYPLYVFLGKALAPALGGPHEALVAVALGFGAFAVALLYALARQWVERPAALAGAVLFALAPALHMNSVIALSYTAEAAASAGVALLAWRVLRDPRPAALAALGVAWAVAVGIRQSLFLFLAPLVAVAVLGWPTRRAGLARRLAWSALPSLAAALAWFLPMLRATGGLREWRHATAAQNTHVVAADAVWRRGWVAFGEHAERLGYYLHWEAVALLPFLAALAAFAWWAARRTGGRKRWPGPPGLAAFALAWVGPAALFYLLVFDGWERGPIGYVLVLSPAIYALAALVAQAAFDAAVRLGHAGFAVLVAVVLAASGIGLAHQGRDLAAGQVAAHDDWAARWQRLERERPANETAILTWQSWTHVKWAFPDHLAWAYFPSYRHTDDAGWAMVFAMQHREDEERFLEMYEAGPGRPEHPVPPWVKTVVVFDFQLAGENGKARRLDPSIEVREETLADGWRILAFTPDAAHPTVESFFAPEMLGPAALEG